jgi:hypothetical protein
VAITKALTVLNKCIVVIVIKMPLTPFDHVPRGAFGALRFFEVF